MDAHEIAAVLALATMQRNALTDTLGWDLLDPMMAMMRDRHLAIKINALIRQKQKQGDFHSAAGLMIWLHTLRAGTSLDLRSSGREMWRELQRAFPHVPAVANGMLAANFEQVNLDGYDQFPIGLTPDPLD